MEIGQNQIKRFNEFKDLIAPASTNPVVVRQDTERTFQYYIRNCVWPKEVYKVTIENQKEIVVRTTNKKYFKKLRIEDMERQKIPLEEKGLTYEHKGTTLTIQYKKPEKIRQIEYVKKEKVSEMNRASNQGQGPRDGDVQCPNQ